VLEQAAVTDVSAACRAAGVSRTSYYRWVAKAEKYGLSALMPKDRRPPVMPNAMSAEEVSTILATAVARATLGARQLVDHLATAGGSARPAASRRCCADTTWAPAANASPRWRR
jgi:transposase-like protein